MKKTKELIAFEMLTNDPNENADKIDVVFLDSKLLRMADKFKSNKPNKANALGRQKVSLFRRSILCRR